MKTGIAIAAVAGLASAAAAQTGFVSLSASSTAVSVGDIVTIGVTVDDDGSTAGVFAFDIQATSGDAGFTVLGDPTFDAAIFGPTGATLANGATGLGGSTDILGPTFDAPLNGVQVYSFQIMITADFAGSITFTSSDGSGPNAALQYAIETPVVIQPGQYQEIMHDSVTLTPAPASMALLGLGGLAATRRRRS